MTFEFIPEGVHTVTDIEGEGDGLVGTTSGPRSTEWQADILDQRDQQSFAWQSTEGSDCAGLITFHELSERLTRLELNLDVVPTNVAERFSLVTHLADRHAEADLRRFKARLELINPDLYEEDEPQDQQDEADEPQDQQDQQDQEDQEDQDDHGDQADEPQADAEPEPGDDDDSTT